MSEQKRKGKGGTVISFLFFMFIGAGAGISMFPALDYILSGEGNMFIGIVAILMMISLMYVALILEMAIHELGHLFFGLLTGYTFISYRLGSFLIMKEEGKLKVKRYSLPGTGGQCLMAPPEYSPTFPVVLYNAGGAIFNFLSSLIFLALFFPFMAAPFLSSFLLMSAFVAFGLGAMNIIPLIYGNDGSNIVAIRKSERERRCFWCQMKMAALQGQGMRLKDMDESLFPVLTKEEASSSMSASALSYRASRLLDEGRIEEAKKIIEEAVSSPFLPQVLVTLEKVDLLYIYLITGVDRRRITEFKDRKLINAMKGMRSFLTVMRTEYAYALLFEGDEKKAGVIAKAFEERASSYPYKGDWEGEKELMDRALSIYETR